MPIVRMPDGKKVRFPDDMSREDIKGFISQKYNQAPQFSEDALAQVKTNNEAYAQRQEENRPWVDKNPVARLGIAAMQGVANSGLNPAGYAARVAGMDTKPFTPQNAVERATELGAEYGFDAAALGGIGKIAQGAGYLGKGQGLASKVAQEVLAPENTTALLSKFVAPAVGGGMLEGAANPQTEVGKTLANIAGAGIVGGIEGGFRRTATNTAGGLKEALPNESANAALSKGVKADKEIARQISKDAPAVYNSLNDDMSQALDKAVGRKLDIERALDSQQERLGTFVARNADYPVFTDKNPNVNNSDANPFEMLVNPREYNRVAKKEQAERGDSLLAFIVKRGGIKDVGGDLKNMDAGKQRIGIINNKSGQSADDVAMAAWENGYFPEKAERPTINDLQEAISEELFGNKRFPNDARAGMTEATDQLADAMNQLGIDYRGMTAQEAETAYNNAVREWSLAHDGGSVNPFVEETITTRSAVAPYIGDMTKGLNKFQKDSFEKALAEGVYHSTDGRGTLGATHKAQEVLNDMIDASYDTKNPFAPRATTETRDLEIVKGRLNQILEPSGVKDFDKSFSKAKALQAAFDKGYNFKPSDIKFEKLGVKTLRDKRAFLQGRLAKIKDNVLSDGGTNLATAVKKDENTLRKLMSKDKFDTLMNKANSIEESFKRLKSIEGQADREILKEIERNGSPWRENIESKGSMLGRAADVLTGWYGRNARKNLANAYLNPNINEIRQSGGLLGALKGMSAADTRQLMIDLLSN